VQEELEVQTNEIEQKQQYSEKSEEGTAFIESAEPLESTTIPDQSTQFFNVNLLSLLQFQLQQTGLLPPSSYFQNQEELLDNLPINQTELIYMIEALEQGAISSTSLIHAQDLEACVKELLKQHKKAVKKRQKRLKNKQEDLVKKLCELLIEMKLLKSNHDVR
jgi:hypothetical protein